ncbi:hypothetical protein LENIMA164B_21905 [Lelliottia nimipressuralis]
MVLAIRCHRQNMKTSIINGSEVSRLSVAIHSRSISRRSQQRTRFKMSSKIFFHYLTLGDFDGQRVEALTMWVALSKVREVDVPEMYALPCMKGGILKLID